LIILAENILAMVSIDFVRTFCLSFEATDEAPHMEVTSFRVNKKIFATLNEKEKRACLKFTPFEQNVFVHLTGQLFTRYPMHGAGRAGL